MVADGVLDPLQLAERLSTGPAQVLGVTAGSIAAGAPGSGWPVPPRSPCTVNPEAWRSAGRNTPFRGWDLPGRVCLTLHGGRVVFDELPSR